VLTANGKAILDQTGRGIGRLQNVHFGVGVGSVQSVLGEGEANDATHIGEGWFAVAAHMAYGYFSQ